MYTPAFIEAIKLLNKSILATATAPESIVDLAEIAEKTQSLINSFCLHHRYRHTLIDLQDALTHSSRPSSSCCSVLSVAKAFIKHFPPANHVTIPSEVLSDLEVSLRTIQDHGQLGSFRVHLEEMLAAWDSGDIVTMDTWLSLRPDYFSPDSRYDIHEYIDSNCGTLRTELQSACRHIIIGFTQGWPTAYSTDTGLPASIPNYLTNELLMPLVNAKWKGNQSYIPPGPKDPTDILRIVVITARNSHGPKPISLPKPESTTCVIKHRGIPMPQETLCKIASSSRKKNLYGPIAKLIAALRAKPEDWRSVMELADNKRGKYFQDTKRRLLELAGIGLAEHDQETRKWRLGGAAFEKQQ